jgi:hypothetical protein
MVVRRATSGASARILTRLLLVTVLVIGARLSATPLTWYIENAALVNGGILTGSFTFDASTSTLSSNVYLVTTQDGAVFPPETWDSENLFPGAGYALTTAIQLVNSDLYGITLDFSTPLTNSGGTIDFPAGGSVICNLSGGGCDLFQSGQVTSQVAALIEFQGGSTTTPVLLSSNEPVSEVTGTIGALGSEEFYLFSWAGGAFSATASITGDSNAGDSYLFSEGAPGNCGDGGTQTLNSGDSFTSTITIGNLAPGQYCVGIEANNSVDPAFAIAFNTPVEATLPEPATLGLLSVGLAILGVRSFMGRKSKGAGRI